MKKQASIAAALTAVLIGTLMSASCNGDNHHDDSDSTRSMGSMMDSAGSSVAQAADTVAAKVGDAFSGYEDSSFVADAIQSNENELRFLDDGISRGMSASLKQHARSMKADHKRLGEQMKAYAKKMHYSMPGVDEEKVNDARKDLNDKKGADWDKAWIDLMTREHRKAIDKFETASKKTEDPPLKTLVDAALPVLQSHRDMLEKLPASM